jgi:hypothetical protein
MIDVLLDNCKFALRHSCKSISESSKPGFTQTISLVDSDDCSSFKVANSIRHIAASFDAMITIADMSCFPFMARKSYLSEAYFLVRIHSSCSL